MSTNEISSRELEEARKHARLLLIWLILELMERISNGSDKTILAAQVWLSDGLLHATLEDLHSLYWLLLPTERMSQTSKSRIDTTALLSRLSVINSEKLSGTSVYQNFKDVELFISTLSSGGYPLKYFFWKGKTERWPDFGGGALFI